MGMNRGDIVIEVSSPHSTSQICCVLSREIIIGYGTTEGLSLSFVLFEEFSCILNF